MHGTRIIITAVLALTVTISLWADKPQSPTTQPESAAAPTSAPAESLAKQILAPSDTVVLPKSLGAQPEELAELVVRFQFDGIPYMDVIRRFSQAADKPLLGEANIEGKLTFVDDRPYSYNDALDTLNTILSMKGFALREEGRFLRIRPLSEMPSTAKIFPGLEQAQDLNPSEIVTVMIPINHVPPDSISAALKPMVSSFGSIAPLVKGNGIIITDRLENIRRLQGLIASMDTETFINHKLKIYTLKHASAKVAADIINKLFGTDSARSMVWDPGSKKLEPKLIDPQTILSVTFDERANLVILVGPEDRLKMAEDALKTLDSAKGPEPEDIRIFELNQAPASDVAKAIEQLLPPAAVQPAQKGAPAAAPQAVRIVPDPIGNRLIVSASQKQMVRIEKLISFLDVPSKKRSQLHIVTLKSGKADLLRNSLLGLFKQHSGKQGINAENIIVEADAETNSLIVSAVPEDWKMAEEIIETLQKAAKTTAEPITKLITLKHAKANDIASVLRAGIGSQPGNKVQIVISPSQQTNSLLLTASQEEMENIDNIINMLDIPATEKIEIRTYKIVTGQASEVAKNLENLFAAKRNNQPTDLQPRFEANKAVNQVLVAATAEQFVEIEKLLQDLQNKPALAFKTQTFKLEYVQADEIVEMLKMVLEDSQEKKQQRPWWWYDYNQEEDVQKGAIRIAALPSANTVIVQATPAKLELAIKLIETLDTKQTGDQVTLKIVTLKNAQAEAVTTALQAMLPGSEPRNYWDRTPEDKGIKTTVSAIPDSNSVLVQGPNKKVEEIVQTIHSLDKAAIESTVGVYVIQLTTGRAGQVTKLIRDMYNQQIQASQRSSRKIGPLAVTADERANAIIISADKIMYDQVISWVKQLEGMKPSRAENAKIIHLKTADPEEVRKAIDQLFNNAGDNGANGSNAAKQIEVTVLPKQKAIMVSASDEEFKAIASLIESLENTAGKAKRITQVITLKNAPNNRIANALDMLFYQQGQTDPDEAVTITALPNSNAIIVAAPQQKLDEITHLIAQLDRPGVAPQVDFRIYRLANAQPRLILPTLTRMLQQIRRAKPGETIDVQADQRTKSIIVTGSVEVFEQVEKIIATLDKAPAYATADVLIVPLRRADATQLAEVLNEMLSPDAGSQMTSEARDLQQQVRLLRVRSSLKEKIPELDLTKPIKITADPARPQGTNSLIISSTPENLQAMAAIVDILDSVPITAGVKVKVIHLENANAANVRTMLEDIFSQGQKLAGKPGTTVAGKAEPETTTGKALVKLLNVSSDMRTNSLILSGEEEVLALAAVLIADLDKNGTGPLHMVRMFPLANAEAARVQQIINSLFTGPNAEGIRPKDRPTIAVDARTNTLVISSSESTFSTLTGLIAQLDKKSPIELQDLRLLKLQSAEVDAIAVTLQKMMDARVKRQESLGVKDAEALRVIVLPDTRSNSLIIGGSPESFKIIEDIAKQLDTASPALGGQIQLFALKEGNSSTIATTLSNLFNQRYQAATSPEIKRQKPIILPDVRTNSLLVAANADDTKMLADLLKNLDVKLTTASVQLVVIPVKHNDAGVIGPVIQQIFQARLKSMTPLEQQQNPQDRVDVAADGLSNSLIISASKDNLGLIRDLLAKVDVAPPDETGIVRMYPLQNSDAERVATMLQSLISQGLYKPGLVGTADSASIKAREKIAIATDTRTNVLIVSASRENFAVIDEIIRNIDGADSTPSNEFRIFTLENATATLLQSVIQKLFDERAARSKDKEKITVIADSRANALIVGAPPEEMEKAEALIKRLDVLPADDKKTLGLFPLEKGNAVQVAETLRNLFKKEDQSQSDITFGVDERLNAIVVSAGKADLDRIGNIIEQLDRKQVTHVTEIKVYPLKNADSEELAKLMMDVLTQKPKVMSKSNPDRQTLLQFINRSQQGRELITSALQEGVLITPDRRTNSLVVTASLENMPLLANLINSLDSSTPQSAEIKVFALQNADASQMAAVLGQLFRATEETGQNRKAPAVTYTLNSTKADGQNETATATTGSAQQPLLNITIDTRTNSLLVGGTKQQVDMATVVINELDSSPARERLTKVYHPRNAQADDIASTITTFLDQERSRLVRALGNDRLGAAERLLEREVAVVAEKTSNTLLISASPRYFRTLAEMIDELDRPPAQVVIQAVLAEVLLTDVTDLGLDWGYNAKIGSSNVHFGDNFKIEASIGADPVGFNVSVAGGDLSFFLRALQRQGRLEVLSRPQILAADNQQAKIDVGERVPLITSSRTTDQNDTINTIEYQPVGVSLQVLPRIGSDRTIRLEVKPEISSVGTRTTQISEHAEAVYLSNRSAETTVTCHDRQTVIIGGLITTTDRDVEDKVPVLGDIPGLGTLFRNTSKERIRNELMIFLTPTILRAPDDARRMTLREFHQNQTLKNLNLNHTSKSFALDSIYDPEIRQAAQEGTNSDPGPQEKRMQSLRQTAMELELLPQQWFPTKNQPVTIDPTVHEDAE